MSVNNTNQSELNQENQEKKIFEPNVTFTPNVIFEKWMPILDPYTFKILMCFCRQIFGWHKESEEISKNQLVKKTNISKRKIDACIEILLSYGLIEVIKNKSEIYGNDPNIYKLKVHKPMHDVHPPSAQHAPPPSAQRAPTKETIYINKYKEINKESTASKDALGSNDPHLCSEYLFNKLKELRPDRKKPDFKKWDLEFKRMIERDKISKEKIIKAIDFIFKEGSLFKVESPESLRKKYENIADHIVIQSKKNTLQSRISPLKNENNEENKILNCIYNLYKNKYFDLQDPLYRNNFLNMNDKYLFDEKRGTDWKTHATLNNFFHQLINNRYVKISSFSSFLFQEYPEGAKYWKNYLTTNVYKQNIN